MTLVVDTFQKLIPTKAKRSPSGWISFNAPCCSHRGESSDTRNRGGIRFDHGIVYHCFNCHFATGWEPGRLLSENFKNLCRWLGANDDDIKKMVFEALKTEAIDYEPEEPTFKIQFEEKALPEGALPIIDWATVKLPEDLQGYYLNAIQYVLDRKLNPLDKDFYWSPADGYRDRVIIPFTFHGKIVGNTARKTTDGRPKYLSDQHPHFVFNVDKQLDNQQYIFVTEGPFDALNINGVAVLTNDVADQQARIINELGKNVIVIPDQDEAGLQLIKKAIHYNWSVAFPNWEDDVKDVADAVKRYGKLFVTVDVIKTAVHGEIKITMALKQLSKKLKRLTDE